MPGDNLEFLRSALDGEQQIDPASVEVIKFKVRTGADVPVKGRMKAAGRKMRDMEVRGFDRNG